MSAAGRIHVGTSGYSFADWVGPFYPPGTPGGEFLPYYARHFGSVEVNSTYYRIPSPRVLERMEQKTPEGFRFVVKLNQAMTHEGSTEAGLYREFLAAIQPLKDAGKYHGLLAQFPWGFKKSEGSKTHLEALRALLPGNPCGSSSATTLGCTRACRTGCANARSATARWTSRACRGWFRRPCT